MDIRRSDSNSKPDNHLTPAQLKFFENLLKLRRELGVPPTVRELQKFCNFASPRSVLQFLDVLEGQGLIERGGGARNIRILRVPDPVTDRSRAVTVPVPIVGTVAAGLPILAEENIEGYIPVSTGLATPPNRYFLLRVSGDSMNRAGIQDGGLVLVRQQPSADVGNRVVALINDEATVKRLASRGDVVVLEPESDNPAHKPIILDENFQVQGVVVTTIEKLERQTNDSSRVR